MYTSHCISGFLDTAEQLKSREKAAQINAAMRKCAPHVYEVMIEDRDRTMAGRVASCEHTTGVPTRLSLPFKSPENGRCGGHGPLCWH